MRTPLTTLLVMLIVAPAWAVKTSHWVHTTEADFKEGTAKGVVATNLGDLKLSRQIKTLLDENARVSSVFSMAQTPDGTIYAGTGPEGLLLAVKDDKVTTAAELGAHTTLLSMLVDTQGRLLIGTGGEKGEILRIEKPGEKPTSIFSAPDIQYIWAMLQTADGILYAATGPTGQLYQINPDGTNKVLLDSDENNLLCIVGDGKDFLYIGTDPNGIVYRVNRKTGEMFVVYDAPEDEVSALVRDGQGNLYVATAETSGDNVPEAPDAAEQVGRPEGETRGGPIPSKPPAVPAPPVPNPAPGEPIPIPKASQPLSLLILQDEPPIPISPGPTSKPSIQSPKSAHGEAENAAKPSTNGNAIYRIDPDGFVTEIFRQPVSVFAMIEQGGSLLVATGSEGALYQVNPAAEETLILGKVDPKEIMCLLPAKDGRVFMGMANAGQIAAMNSGYADSGTFTSAVLDAKQISRFGKIQLLGTLPASTGLTVATRSGNVEEASAPGWSRWSEEVPAAQFIQSPSPTARFFQYRLTFKSSDGKATPVVEEVNVAYQVPNVAPEIKSIKIPQPDDDDGRRGTGKVTLTWIAGDPNEDELVYTLRYRQRATGPWILLKENLKDPTFDWDTRNVADGRYEIKVEASDAAANPTGLGKTASRVSDPIVVDNTPPIIGDISTAVGGPDAAIKLKVADRTSTIGRLDYSIDGSENWQTVLPSDNIADSPEEAYDFVVPSLPAGAHQIALRATDSQGNRAFEAVAVTIEKK